MKAQQIAEIAILLGEMYILRFKVNFIGESRGFAYLQYLNPSLMPLALKRYGNITKTLNQLFNKILFYQTTTAIHTI